MAHKCFANILELKFIFYSAESATYRNSILLIRLLAKIGSSFHYVNKQNMRYMKRDSYEVEKGGTNFQIWLIDP